LTLSFFVIFFSLISFYSDYKEHDLGGFCFSSICIKNFTNTFTGGLRILENGIKYIALLAAIYGAMIALNNYKLSLKTSSLTSHISHLSLFQNYIEKESKKIGIYDSSTIDTFHWYRIMFPDSKRGNVEISNQYKRLLKDLDEQIILSDTSISTANSEIKYTFTNSDHQRRIILALSKIGIILSRQKMSEFFESESNIFRLLDSVNATFTGLETEDKSIPKFNRNRAYL